MGTAVLASRSLHLAALLGLAALGLPAQAKRTPKAEEAPAEPAAGAAPAPPPTQAPAVRAVAFVDRAPDCDPVEAWYGDCVEWVDLLDLGPAWREGAEPSREDRAAWWNLGELYARMWEDVAVRWGAEDDVLQATFGEAGIVRLPASNVLWEATARGRRMTWSLPDRALWLDEATWRTPRAGAATSVEPWFRDLAVAHAAGLPEPSPVALLRGRFATRLAYDGKRHPYDLMDGDTDASGPFHEQMYPFQTALESGDPELQPLRHFVVPEPLKRPGLDPDAAEAEAQRKETYAPVSFPASAGLAGARALALQEFRRFFHLVGTQIVRFALEEYTPTHMRVLTALIAMDTPPGRLLDSAVARDVVAASEGQTDDEALIQSLIDTVALDEGGRRFEIDYSQIPPPVVDAWLGRFPEIHHPPPALLAALEADVLVVLQELLRPGTRGPQALDEAGLRAWVDAAALPGRAPDVYKHVQRLTLRLLVEQLGPKERDEVETRLLLDHVELDVSSRFDTTPGYRATPQDLEASAAARWKGALGRHGFSPRPIPDGPGAVDPIAICTTKDRKEALSEPVFGVVHLDLLLVAQDGLQTADAVLWAAREQAPFVMLDDPSSARPVVNRLFGLPEGRALYRVRWQVWNGWHLFWGVEPVAASGEDTRLVLRTGAVCEDTVLASPDLVPTLARAALLEGELRGTHAVKGLSRRERREIEEREVASADALVADARAAASAGRSAAFSAEASADAASEDPERMGEIASAQTGRAGSLVDRDIDERPVPVTPASDAVTYIQSLMRAPLYELAAAAPALAVTVFSTRVTERREPGPGLRPRTPYFHEQTGAGRGTVAITAAWMWDLQLDDDEPSVAMLAPAYRPTESVSAGSPVARWKRTARNEFALDLGLGAFPLRASTYACSEDPEVLSEVNALSTVAPCSADGPVQTSETSGLLLDLSMPITRWVHDEPRLAVEFGPELQVLLLPQGAGLLWPGGEPDYTWTWSARAGLLAGLRLAPDPTPLRRLGDRAPWGAERPDGSSDLGRVQGGIRFGALLGPGFNGLELTGTSELWLGFALRNPRSTAATFTPWHPITVLGPYARGQFAGVIGPGEEPRYYEIHRRMELIVGVRGQVRLTQSPGKPPEVP